MKKVNYFAIISLIVLVLSFVIPSFITKDITSMMLACVVFSVVALVLAIIAIIYAGKIEKSKAPGIILTIISVIVLGLFGLIYMGLNIIQDPEQNEEFCKQVVKCEKGKKDISTCYIDGDKDKIFPVKCLDENLEDEQYK